MGTFTSLGGVAIFAKALSPQRFYNTPALLIYTSPNNGIVPPQCGVILKQHAKSENRRET